mgnify:CR=1 FL=1
MRMRVMKKVQNKLISPQLRLCNDVRLRNATKFGMVSECIM